MAYESDPQRCNALWPSINRVQRLFANWWRGVGDNRLNLKTSNSGSQFKSKVTLQNTTTAQPTLLTRGDIVYLAWRGVENQRLNVQHSLDGKDWRNKITLREQCVDCPAVTTLN